jgi:hypothetical protein
MDRKTNINYNTHNSIYGIGVIGALVYFIQHAATFWEGVLGVIEAIFWPAVIVYKALEFLKL